MCCESDLNGRITLSCFQRTLVLLIVQHTSDLRMNVAHTVKCASWRTSDLLSCLKIRIVEMARIAGRIVS